MGTPLDDVIIPDDEGFEDYSEPLVGENTPSEELEGEEVARLITTIVTEIDRQERTTRDRRLRLWKYLELLWSGSGNYYWDHLTGQWRAITQEDITLIAQEADIDPTLLNKVINLIRPYGESLVGVLSTGTPRVKYFPEDADEELDINASKAYTNVEKKIADDNYMNIRLMEILVKIWNGGFSAAYNYSHSDKKYGIFEEKVYEDLPFEQESLICVECGEEFLGEERQKESLPEPAPVIDEAEEEEAPNTDLSIKESLEPEDQLPPETTNSFCPNCEMETPHISSMVDVGTRPIQTGTNAIPKSRQIIEIFGPMNIKIPSLAAKEEDIIWLIKEEEKHIALARSMFSEHRDKIDPHSNSDLDVDRQARASYEISDDTLMNYATIRWCWLKPAAFEILENVEDIKKLRDKYPSGVKAIFSSEVFLEAEEESLDEHWTVSINPLYPVIQSDPLGKALIGLHESANDLFQLEIDTVRYSIPETFADPQYLDFNARSQSRALPGALSPMKRPPGGSLEDNLASTKTATIPKEVENLDLKIEKLLQFISGVLPSVFGGPATGSKTLGEYQESKNQALQRLSIIWKVVSVMYARVMAKATKAYVANLLEDEKFIQEKGTGNFLNVWIRKADFEGRIGEVRPELSEQFPTTWGQVSSKVMELLGMNNQIITSWLLHPENVELIYKVLGIDDLYVPGEDQRNKQLYEISQLILAEPIVVTDPNTGEPVIDPNTGQPAMQSSVPIEPIDDHQIHMVVDAAYLNSPMGIDLKQTNPAAYQNVTLHYQEHQQAFMQQQMEAAAQGQEAEGENSESVE